ncbi:MAG: WbqC family protein [Prevotella sp.]|nr:WbqC family protein [Prevotella sp.]
MLICFPTTYFGPISWYSRLVRADEWAIDDAERYVKQTTRNHCLIATASGVQKLTVPVEKPRSEERGARSEISGSEPLLTRDVRISNHGKWRTEHWNALCTAYGESPFFDYYADDLRPFFERRDWEFLLDYNMAILEKMLELIGVRRQEFRSLGVQTNDNCQLSIVNCQLSGSPYWQVYQRQNGFLPDLSILDLLFCMGPEAVLWL